MLIEELKKRIDNLEERISNPIEQSEYFRWGIESQKRNLRNYKSQFEELREKFYEIENVDNLERELTDLVKNFGNVKVEGFFSGLYKLSIKTKINSISEMIEMKDKYEDIDLYEFVEK